MTRTGFFAKAGCNVAFEFTQGRWLERLKINFNFIWIRVAQSRLSRLNNLYNLAQFVTFNVKTKSGNDKECMFFRSNCWQDQLLG